LFGQNSRTNAEGFGKLIEVAFQQMDLASDVSRQVALRNISKPLAEFLVGNIATQHLNLREQMKAEIASDARRMLRASHGQNNLIVDYNNQLLRYSIHLLGLAALRMLAFPWFDYYGKTVTGCPRTAWPGAGRAGKAFARGDRNHPKDGIF
jgi:hypothetical protein